MTQINMDQLGVVKTPLPGSSSFWTPQNVGEIIKGIKDLIIEYQKMKGIIGNQQAEPMAAPSNAVTTSMIQEFIKRFFDELIKQGNGDMKISQVIEELPYTVKQLRALIH